MIDLIKKTLLTGIGAAAMTREKVEAFGKKFIKEAKLSEAEGKKFLDELTKKSQDARKAIDKTVREAIDKTLAKIEVPTRKEITELRARIAELEKELAAKGRA
jgi:polyhydroxyalkanoate synthesis regulator phasin